MTIYIRREEKWLKKSFRTEKQAMRYLKKHKITEYNDIFGYRTIKIGG